MSDAADYLLKSSEFLITNVHELTASPWYISIPLFALITSATIRTPTMLLSLSMARKRARFAPLMQAHTMMTAKGLRGKNSPDINHLISTAVLERSSRLSKTFGTSQSRSVWASLLSLPIFISNIEILRRMCGARTGLLGLLTTGSQATHDEITTTPASPPGTAQPIESGELVVSASPGVQDTTMFEPALADDGCLWFPNLLEADPYHVLPLAVSAVMLLSVLPETSAARRDLLGLSPSKKDTAVSIQSKVARAVQRALPICALGIGPLTMYMPAAVHLYWVSSLTTSLVINKGLKKLMLIPNRQIMPCRTDIPVIRPKPPTSSKST